MGDHPPAKAPSLGSSTDASREIVLRFHAGDFAGGNVPVAVLAQKLQALQSLLYHASAAVQGSRLPRLGQWVAKHRNAAELAFDSSEPGSLLTKFVLRNTDSSLFEVQAKTLSIAMAAVVAGANGELPASVSRDDAMYLLQSVEDLCPSTFDDYQIDVSMGRSASPIAVLNGQTRAAIRERLKSEEIAELSDEPEWAYGILVQTNIGKGENKIVIHAPRDGGRTEIDCYYPDYLRDQIANLVGGSLVEVMGFATQDSRGAIEKFHELISVEMMDTEPIRLRTLEANGLRFEFKQPSSFDVEYVGGVWAYSNELLNVSGFANSRRAALSELAEAMAYVWREFALAQDDELDSKAIELKRRLLHSVSATSLAGGAS